MSNKNSEATKNYFFAQLGQCSKGLLPEMDKSLQLFPEDAYLLLFASLASLIDESPEKCLGYLSRYNKRYRPIPESRIFEAFALAQQGKWLLAANILEEYKFNKILKNPFSLRLNFRLIPNTESIVAFTSKWLDRIKLENKQLAIAQKKALKKAEAEKTSAKKALTASIEKAKLANDESKELEEIETTLPPLITVSVNIPIRLNLPKASNILPILETVGDESIWFKLRNDFAHLNLLQGFDELLCLPLLHNIDIYWYQVETVRKVLKQFHGRVLLADEVGLGKTIEAGMVLKEYLMRSMVEKVLILTPASLVGQWLEEMSSKFDIEFASSYDQLVRSDPEAFWSQPRVIASIATARRAEHLEILMRQSYDLLIVDEAHHLKNRTTSNWKLVDVLRKRFLLLLSATPVQNSLLELYNLLTLLKPGIFKTEKEFRTNYMVANKPRVPANRERMRDLMLDAMIRNTRSMVDLKLPPRQAITIKLTASAEESECYQELSKLLQQSHKDGTNRMALRHLLSAAGSSPSAATTAITRFISKKDVEQPWTALHKRYQRLSQGIKESALFDLLKRNPDEKKMIFVHHKETLEHLDKLLQSKGMVFSKFEGTMSGPEKDRAIERFHNEVPLLLCTESGGEGRNLQFCNTLINFDLPWNPMAIEQRIGRIHRIGQTRQVFIFNLVVLNTIEEYILSILDEKINMFELVVGEIGSILGEMDEDHEFAEIIFNTWVETTEQQRQANFDILAKRLLEAKLEYEKIKSFDTELFGDDFEVG
ncbi:MAG: SNF2-like protein [bacterium]|nr:MAG: SNF2-like protein [bacterium]